MTDHGWISPAHRTPEQLRLTYAYHQSLRPVYRGDPVPDTALLPLLELRVLGRLAPRIWQQSGSCVGAGAARAYLHAIIGDIACRGDRETVEVCYPWATYGMGRQLGGLRGRGDGSFGAAQAQAVREWGMLRSTDSRLPKATQTGLWLRWTAETEREWSWPPSWPVRIEASEAQQYRIGEAARITTVQQAAEMVARGYGITLASMLGTSGARDRGGVLIANWDDQWAHQMPVPGYATHPQEGRIWLVDNNWGPGAHKACPWLAGLLRAEAERLGVAAALQEYAGSFWIHESTFADVLADRNTECYAHSDTAGFDPRPPIDWDTIDWSKVVTGVRQ